MKPEKIAKLQEIENALQELDTLLQNPLTDYKKISPKALAQIEQIRSITKQHRQALDNNATTKSFESTTMDDDIPRTQYVKILEGWCDDLVKNLGEVAQKVENIKAEVIVKHVAMEIGNLFGESLTNPTLPSVWKTLSAAFDNIKKEKETIKMVSEGLLKQVAEVKKKAVGYYNEKGTEMKAEYLSKKTISFPDKSLIIKAILAPADPEAAKKAQEAEEKRKAAEEEKKAEEAYAKAVETFDSSLLAWSHECHKTIVPDARVEINVNDMQLIRISKTLLASETKVFFTCNPNILPMAIQNKVLALVEQDKEDGFNKLTVEQTIDIVNKVITSLADAYKVSKSKILFDAWRKNTNVFPSPGLLRNWVNNSVPMMKTKFMNSIEEWKAKMETVIGGIYGEKTNVSFVKERLNTELRAVFGYGELSAHTQGMYDKYLQLTTVNTATPNVKTLEKGWGTALGELSKNLPAVYKDLLEKGVNLADFIKELPKYENIAIALDLSEYHPAPAKSPKEETHLMDLQFAVETVPREDSFKGWVGRWTEYIGGTAGVTPEWAQKWANEITARMLVKGTILPTIPLKYVQFNGKTADNKDTVLWFALPADNGSIDFDSIASTLDIDKMKIKATSGATVKGNCLTRSYEITYDFMLPSKAISAATEAATSGGIVVVDYSHANTNGTEFSISSEANTMRVIFDFVSEYVDGKLVCSIKKPNTPTPITFKDFVQAEPVRDYYIFHLNLVDNSTKTLTPFPK